MTEFFEGVEGTWVPVTRNHPQDDPEWNKGHWRYRDRDRYYKDGVSTDYGAATPSGWERFVPVYKLPTEPGSIVIPPSGSEYYGYYLTNDGWIDRDGDMVAASSVIWWLTTDEDWTVYDAGSSSE